jgi:hypothetical protein
MLCLPDYNKPYILSSLTAPVVVRHHWIFKGDLCDFMLSPITYLEETSGAAVKVRINNFEFWIPATWNILVTDRDTFQLDTVSIQSCASVKHDVFVFSPNEMKLRTLTAEVIDYQENSALVHPMINKGTALVHPIGPSINIREKDMQLAIAIGPHDLYKHLANKVVGDIFS